MERMIVALHVRQLAASKTLPSLALLWLSPSFSPSSCIAFLVPITPFFSLLVCCVVYVRHSDKSPLTVSLFPPCAIKKKRVGRGRTRRNLSRSRSPCDQLAVASLFPSCFCRQKKRTCSVLANRASSDPLSSLLSRPPTQISLLFFLWRWKKKSTRRKAEEPKKKEKIRVLCVCVCHITYPRTRLPGRPRLGRHLVSPLPSLARVRVLPGHSCVCGGAVSWGCVWFCVGVSCCVCFVV